MKTYLVLDPETGIGDYTVEADDTVDPSGIASTIVEVDPAEVTNPGAWRMQDGTLGPYTPPVDQAQLRQRARRMIYKRAERLRGKYLKLAPGQIMTYLEKEKEAHALMADPAPALENYPFLVAEFGSDLMALSSGAADVIAKAHLTRQMAAQIEGVRTNTNRLIDVAETKQELRAILQAAVMPPMETP